MIFKGQVLNTLMSGLEAEVLRVCDYEKLEKCMMKLARKLCGLKGTYAHGEQRRMITNVEVRQLPIRNQGSDESNGSPIY